MTLSTIRPTELDVAFRQPPVVRGKFLYVGDEKLYVRGVTYGPFEPDLDGNEWDEPTVDADFARMAATGINTVRVYTVPPRWLLDLALQYGLWVLIGQSWEQHACIFDDRERLDDIERRVREGVRTCAGHPAVLGFAIGNEIPASVVRWHGPRPVERFLERLYRAVKEESPRALVTYVNFPTTEYLSLPFLNFLSFNVYLEEYDRLDAYLARVQNLAGDRPLVLTEVGLDSLRQSEARQAETLDWQIRTAFAAGCAGVLLFAWTDEWWRGGHRIEDWDFGLTRRDRSPKPALASVQRAFADVPFPAALYRTRVSVIVCSYNGSRTIDECLRGIARLNYPNFETIVIDDGSTDETAAIARRHDVQVISTPNQGLSAARNLGLSAATGEIVAYIDDDAWPDPDWLSYVVAAFQRGEFVGIGGPNLPPEDESPLARAVAQSPGNPVHVLLDDREAEHIPGCNMAFDAATLRAAGGFDSRFRVAGDDVDACWRIQERGGKLGYAPAALVWHHRRSTVRTYWKQQWGYGKAEALLERKWPEHYNTAGQRMWTGRIYGAGQTRALHTKSGRIYQGPWGTSLFQSLYAPASHGIWALPLMPEWNLIIAALAALTALGALWPPLLLTGILLVLAIAAPIAQAVRSAAEAQLPLSDGLGVRAMVALFHLVQPFARLGGRLSAGLSPLRGYATLPHAIPRRRLHTIWSEYGESAASWLAGVEGSIRALGLPVLRGGGFDRWDLEIRGGTLGTVRLLLGLEEHGAGRQLARFRIWPRYSPTVLVLTASLAVLALLALLNQAWIVAALLGVAGGALVVRMFQEGAIATFATLSALQERAEAVACRSDDRGRQS